jgi:hypothetical protein
MYRINGHFTDKEEPVIPRRMTVMSTAEQAVELLYTYTIIHYIFLYLGVFLIVCPFTNAKHLQEFV